MARKTMPASRKRRSVEDDEQHEHHQVEIDVALHDHDVSQGHCSTPPLFTFMSPSSSSRAPSHSQSKRMGMRLTTGKKRKHQMPMLDNCDYVSEVLEGMSKPLNLFACFQKGNSSATGYGLDCSSPLFAENHFSKLDIADTFVALSAWAALSHNLAVKRYISHFIKWSKLKTNLERHTLDEPIAANPLENPVCTCLQKFEHLLYQAEVNGGQEATFSTLLNTFLHLQRLCGCGKRKKACLEGLVTTASWMFPKKDGKQMYYKKLKKCGKTGPQCELCTGRENPFETFSMTGHQMSHTDLENWIVKHSIPSKQNSCEGFLCFAGSNEKEEEENKSVGHTLSTNFGENDSVLMVSDNNDKTEGSLKPTKSEIKIEVNLSGRSELLEQSDVEQPAGAATSNITYLKHILKVVSFKVVHSNGDYEAMVLFKALRSDEREVIVDNSYLRSMYPILVPKEDHSVGVGKLLDNFLHPFRVFQMGPVPVDEGLKSYALNPLFVFFYGKIGYDNERER